VVEGYLICFKLFPEIRSNSFCDLVSIFRM